MLTVQLLFGISQILYLSWIKFEVDTRIVRMNLDLIGFFFDTCDVCFLLSFLVSTVEQLI